jgi:hypothetical protein
MGIEKSRRGGGAGEGEMRKKHEEGKRDRGKEKRCEGLRDENNAWRRW